MNADVEFPSRITSVTREGSTDVMEIRLVDAEVRVVSAKPGDVVLLKVPADALMFDDVLGEIAVMMKKALPEGVEVRVLAMDGDLAVSVVESSEPNFVQSFEATVRTDG